MSKKRRSFQITSVTSSDHSQSAPSSRGSSSQPTTPSLIRKSSSQDASSRFRVIRLAAGRGQPYRRGRWTCMDFLEREERAGLRRLMDSMRHAHSLESLDAIGRLDREGGDGAGLGRGAGGHPHVHSHGASHLLAGQPIRREGPPAPPANQESKRPIRVQHFDSAPPLRLDVDSAGRSVLRLSVSPGVSQPDLNPTVFTLPEDSDAGSSMVAIDNKIEQAMDLVKSHLQTAVREEVEMLREQIKELQERNDELERENYILRCLH